MSRSNRISTPRIVRKVSVSMPAPQPTELQMEVGVQENEILPIVMSSGGSTTVDPELTYHGKNKMLMVPSIDTDQIVSPHTLTLHSKRVVVVGDLFLDDGFHKLNIPYPTKANTLLFFDGFQVRWMDLKEMQNYVADDISDESESDTSNSTGRDD